MIENSNKSAATYTQLAKTAIQMAYVSDLLKLFHQAGVPLILLKGIALMGRVYSTAEQRPMQDIDVLIRQEDFQTAVILLQAQGYYFSDKTRIWNEAFAREFMGNVAYSKAGVAFDIHWHPVTMSWFRTTTAFDLNGLWTRAIPAEIAGAPALRLCPEDEVLHLCYHTAIHHGLTHPHGYRDILGVLRVEQDALDWTALVERARAWRVSVAVWAALSVARSKVQEARGKRQETEDPKPKTQNPKPNADLIPLSALEMLHVPRWRQRLLRPFVQQAVSGRAALVSGTMRFLGVLLVDRLRDLPGVVLHGLFPGRRWLQLRYNLSPRQAFWRQFTYPLQVLARGAGALVRAVVHHS